jgi:hypothetical protein
MAEPTPGPANDNAANQVNEARAQMYTRLMDAQEQIALRLYERGVSHQAVLDALDVVDEELSEDERREDLYLAALARYVGALGGCIEVRAVFESDEILVRQEPR